MDVLAPVAARVAQIPVTVGAEVSPGQTVAVLDVMKMERRVEMAERGSGVNLAVAFEIDDIIDPAESRRWITTLLLG